MTKMTVDQLVALGGKVWEKGTMRRVYFNYEELAKFYGLEYTGFGFKVDGEKVSNNSGRIFEGALRNGKFWFDLATGEFGSKDMSEAMTAKLIERITKAAEELVAETSKTSEPAEKPVATEAPAKVVDSPVTTTVAKEAPTGIGIRTAVGPGLPPGVKVYTNRKPGYCRCCGKLVPAGQGHLYYIDPDEAYEDSGWIVEHKGSCPTSNR